MRSITWLLVLVCLTFGHIEVFGKANDKSIDLPTNLQTNSKDPSGERSLVHRLRRQADESEEADNGEDDDSAKLKDEPEVDESKDKAASAAEESVESSVTEESKPSEGSSTSTSTSTSTPTTITTSTTASSESSVNEESEDKKDSDSEDDLRLEKPKTSKKVNWTEIETEWNAVMEDDKVREKWNQIDEKMKAGKHTFDFDF